ncbi:MAG: HAD family hydrolase [Candidatus Kapaibacterium sp.]
MIDWTLVKSVYFDLDNTLIDHTGAEERAFHHCYEACGLSDGRFTVLELLESYRRINDELWSAYRRGEVTTDVVRRERFRRILELQFDARDFDLSPDEVSSTYLHAYDTASVPLEGAAEAIALTKRHSGFIGVITNGFPRQVTRKLEHQGWTATFDVITISSLIGVAKPHPDVFKAALATRDHDPGEAVYVGDNYEADVVGASNARWKTVYLRNTHDRPVSESDADLVIDSLPELHPYLRMLTPMRRQGA